MTPIHFRTILTVILLLPALCVAADSPPPLFNFAPLWLDKHPLTEPEAVSEKVTPTKSKISRSATAANRRLIEKERQAENKQLSSQLALEQKKVKELNALVEKFRNKDLNYEMIVRERDNLKESLAKYQSHQQAHSTPCLPADSLLRDKLQAAENDNSTLHRQYNAAKDMLDSARALNKASTTELATMKGEVARLRIEGKVSALQVDIANSKLTALHDLHISDQQKIEDLILAETRAHDALIALRNKIADEHNKDGESNNPGLVTPKEFTDSSLQTNALQPDMARGIINSPENNYVHQKTGVDVLESRKPVQPTGDYAAGVAIGYEASGALEMNRMLGVPTNLNDLISGFSDALLHQVKFPEQQLANARGSISKQVQIAREQVIKAQKDAGKKALEEFRLQSGATKDSRGFWYKIDTSGGPASELQSTVSVSVKTTIAGGEIIQDSDFASKKIIDFPPLFRDVVAKIGRHGSASFLVPPSLAYGDEGLPPHIPPGATLLYQLTIGGSDKDKKHAEKSASSKVGQQFFEAFIHQPGVVKASSGFWYQIKEKGTGKPLIDKSMVTTVIRESIAGGPVIDDMVADKRAITLPLYRYPSLFRDALKLIKNHGAVRLVAPSNLAYGDGDMPAEVPSGALMVYDIRIVKVEKEDQPNTDEPSDEVKNK